MFFLPTVNNAYTYTSIKVINPSVNQITLPSGFIIGSSSIVEDSYIVQLYDNVKKEREVNHLNGGETTQNSTKTKTPIKFDFTESATSYLNFLLLCRISTFHLIVDQFLLSFEE
jgi:hypothetical protein